MKGRFSPTKYPAGQEMYQKDASKEETTSADVAIQAFAKISLTPTPRTLPMPTARGPTMKEGAIVESRLPR